MGALVELKTASASEPLLSVEGLEVSYGAIRALRGISLKVLPDQVTALIGRNGAGKSSALRAISGMLKPAAGRIVFAGEEVTGLKAHQLAARNLAHAPEGRGIFQNLSVEENLALGSYLRRDRSAIAADEEKYFGLFPRLKERRKQMAATLSGGEQQMLAIARALMSRPRLLLLDEPSLGLAPVVTEQIFSVLRDLNAQGVSILLVEQNAALALSLAHHAYVLETGEVALEGTGEALLRSEEVRKTYLGE